MKEKLKEITNFLRSKGMKKRTISTYIYIINRITKDIGYDFKEKDLENYLVKLNLNPSSYNLYRSVINFYTEKELGYKITFSKAKKNNFLPTEVTKEEFNTILNTIPSNKHKIGFRLMYESGLRVDEVVNTKKHDLKLDDLTIRVRGKGNKDRYTILNPKLAEDIKEFMKSTYKDNPYLFQNKKTHLTTKTFQTRIKKAIIDAKITKKISCHSLRHGFAINMVNNGIDIDILKKLLGHSSIRTTQIYLKCRTIDLTKIAMNR